MGWIRNKLKKGPPYVPLRVNIGVRSVLVTGLFGVFMYGVIFEPPRIWYHVRQRELLQHELLQSEACQHEEKPAVTDQRQ